MSIPDCAETAVPPAPLNDAAIARVARRFAVLAEPMRLRLLHALFAGEKSVGAWCRNPAARRRTCRGTCIR